MTLQALREKIGDDAFFTLLRTWFAENEDGNVTTADFIATAERVSGQQLDAFFDVWLYQPVKPTIS
jgi:aminopeptidase N